MNISELSVDAIEARLDELKGITENPEERSNDEMSNLLEEVKTLNSELEARKAKAAAEAEERAAAAADASAPVTNNFDDKVEVKNMFEVNSAEYRSAWLRNLQGAELTAEERTAVSASAAIPQQTLNMIKGKMELYPLLNAVNVMNIPGTVIIPVEGTVNAAAIVGMGDAATDSTDTVGSVSLSVYKLIKTVEITADVAAMAIDAFETWLTERLANKMYRLVTKLVAAGSGTSEPAGLTTISATTLSATEVYGKLLEIVSKLPTEYLPNAKFVMNRSNFFTKVLGAVDSNNKPIVVADAQAPAKYNVLGYPVIIEDEVGTSVVFGDLNEGYVWNFGKGIAVDRDESVGFRTGSTCFRGMALADGKPTGIGLIRVASI